MIDATGTTRLVVMTGCHLDFGTPVSNTVPIFGSTVTPSKLHVSGQIHLKRTAPLDISGAQFCGTLECYTGVTIVDTVGSYRAVYQPDTSAHRIERFKGAFRVVGTAEGTDVTEWVQFQAAASGGTPAVTASSDALALPTTLTAGGVAVKKAGKETIGVPAAAMVSAITSGAAPGQIETSTNKVNQVTLDFDPSSIEYAGFTIPMPKSWNEGTVTAQFIWSHSSTSTNFGVTWGIQGLARSDDDALDTAFGTAVTVSDTGGTTNDEYITSETSAMTIGGTPAEGDVVHFRVYRDPTDGSDTMAVDARLHAVRIFFTTNAGTDA
jgi:hypothetical protein